MFKILSHVHLLLACLFVFAGSEFLAIALGTDPSMAVAETSAIITDNSTESERDRRFLQEACKAATSDWTTKVGELAEACSSTHINLESSEDVSGEGIPVACSNTMRCCLESAEEYCENKMSDELKADMEKNNTFLEELLEQQSNYEKDDSNFSQLAGIANKIKKNQALTKLYGQCPMRGAVGNEKAREQADEAREKLEEKEDAVSELNEKINEAQSELEKNKLKIKNEMMKLELTTKEKLKEIQDQQEDDIKRLMEQIEASQSQIRELQRQIAQLEMGKADASDDLNNKVTELKVGCYDEALGKAQRTRSRVMERAANNQYSADSLTTLYKSVGSSTLEDTQKLVEYHRKLCENDYRFKESVKIAYRSYEKAVSAADRTISTINSDIGLIRIAITKLQNSERLKAHQDAMEKIELLQQAYKNGLESLQQQYINLVNTASYQVAELRRQLAQKNAHLEEAKEHLSYKNSLLELRKKATGGDMNMKEETWAKAVSSYYALRGIAITINDSCNCESETSKAARAFLTSIGRSIEEECNNANKPSSSGSGTTN